MTRLLILFMCVLLPFLSCDAAELQLSPIASEKQRERVLFLPGGHVIYFFTDNTIVYLRHPPYESQTWEEWWNDIEHPQSVPQFYFKLITWNSFHFFQLYQYEWKDHVNVHCLEPIFSNSRVASDYPCFIENSITKEMTLCQVWSLAELGAFISRYAKEQYNDGYRDGQNSCRH